MFELIKHVVYDSIIDNEPRVIEVLQKMIDDMEDEIQVNGHIFTSLRINSRYREKTR